MQNNSPKRISGFQTDHELNISLSVTDTSAFTEFKQHEGFMQLKITRKKKKKNCKKESTKIYKES